MKLIPTSDIEVLIPLLHDADEDDERIRSLARDGWHQSYLVSVHDDIIGAAMMRWQMEQEGLCEVEYIAIKQSLRGKGHGRMLMKSLLEEARRRGMKDVLVGTDNTALETIAFYQRCGFRMDHVRRDFFSYINPTLYHHGIAMRDMLVLRYTFD